MMFPQQHTAAMASTVTTELTASVLRVWELPLGHNVTITYERGWQGGQNSSQTQPGP